MVGKLERLTGALLRKQLELNPETEAYIRDFQMAVGREGIQGDGVPPILGPAEWARRQFPSEAVSVTDKICKDLLRLTGLGVTKNKKAK